MKKKILICLRSFGQGGISRCLQTLMYYIDTEHYEVDVFCLTKDGPYLKDIPNCRILDAGFFVRNLCVFSSTLTWKNLWSNLPVLLCKTVNALSNKLLHRNLMHKKLDLFASRFSGKYDVAIAYEEGDIARVVANMRCATKLIWLHNDYEWVAIAGKDTDFSKFDKICCVSEATRKSFIKFYPQLNNRTLTIHNLVNVPFILKSAEEPCRHKLFSTDSYVIISIGRISPQKHFDAIPSIAKQLRDKSLCFKWYIIGKGPDESLLQQEIKKNEVEDCVIQLGEQQNPYKFLKQANLFALTSRYESYPTVINEALVLDLPIISTDIPSAYEMLEGIPNTEIVPLEKWSESIASFISYGSSRTKIDFRLKNEKVLQQFYSLME